MVFRAPPVAPDRGNAATAATLAGLQQEGKVIGVISHVPALKERISTQIQVTPQTGGRSQISGPGCGRLNAAVRAVEAG